MTCGEVVRIYYEALARGIYDLMDTESQEVLQAGLVPLNWLNLAIEQFIAKAYRENWEGDLPSMVNDFRSRLSTALLQVARA